MASCLSAAESTDSASQPASLNVPPKPSQRCFLEFASAVTSAVPVVTGVSVPVFQKLPLDEVTTSGRVTRGGAPAVEEPPACGAGAPPAPAAPPLAGLPPVVSERPA